MEVNVFCNTRLLMKILITGASGFVGRNGKYQAVVTAMGYLSSMDDVAEIEDALKSRLT